MKRAWMIFCLVPLLAGCSAEWFRQSADNQVLPMVRDRERKTTGYEAQVQVNPMTAPAVPQSAYAKIPQTPIAPPMPSPLEIPQTVLPFVELGPPFPTVGWQTSEQIDRELGVGGPIVGADENYYGPPVPQSLRRMFALFDALAYGTQHSRPYQNAMEDLYLSALDVTLQRHLFEPQPFGNAGLQFTGGQADAKYQSALNATSALGVKQNLPYGGQVTAKALVGFVDALNSTTEGGESAQVALTGSIPLLRGAGMVNLEPLIQSERTLIYQVRTFEQFRRQFAVDVARQYFNLLVLQQRVFNRRLNVSNLTALVERTQALFGAGRINFLEVQRSQQALLDGEDSLSTSLISYDNAIDNFKVILGMPIDEDLDVRPVELDVNVPNTDHVDVVTIARHFRLDLQTARDQIEDAKRQVDVAKNGLLPDLDVTANTQFGNDPTSPAKNLNNKATTYSAGINLDLPLDRLAERNIYRAALISFDRAQRSFVDLNDSIAAEVRSDVRSIHSAQVSVDIQRRGIRLAERRLEYSLELLRRGTGNARDVTDAQTSLLTSQDSFSQARANLQVQVLEFLKDSGTIRIDPSAGSLGQALDRAAGQIPEEPPPLPMQVKDDRSRTTLGMGM
jgi:outer membrane protein TolC